MLIFIYLFLAISFGYSLFEKLIDQKGYIQFLNHHLKLPKLSKLFWYILVLMNLATTLFNFFGIILETNSIQNIETNFIFYTNATAILILLVGQRIANDYQGAANLGIYFLVNLAGFYLKTLI